MHSQIGTEERNVEIDEEEKVDEEAVIVEDAFPEEEVADDIESSDNVGDVSVEINVEELIAEIESTHDDEGDRRAEVRRRLEEMRDQQEISKELEDTFMRYMDEDD